MIPALGLGITQAILAPSVIAAANTSFPARFRGLGTTLVLASFDVGYLIGAPTAGLILHFSTKAGLPAYPIMFATMAITIMVVAVSYAVIPSREPVRKQAIKRANQIAARELAKNSPQPAKPYFQVASKSIDPVEPYAYHPPVELEETLSMDTRGNTGNTDIGLSSDPL
jgi:MFS family permease